MWPVISPVKDVRIPQTLITFDAVLALVQYQKRVPSETALAESPPPTWILIGMPEMLEPP
jgi:hypothetical protein